MQEQGRPDPAEMQRGMNRLAEVLRDPQDRKRLKDDPRGFLARNDIQAVPDAALDALADLSPQELELFAQVHSKLARVSDEILEEGGVGIVF